MPSLVLEPIDRVEVSRDLPDPLELLKMLHEEFKDAEPRHVVQWQAALFNFLEVATTKGPGRAQARLLQHIQADRSFYDWEGDGYRVGRLMRRPLSTS